jgi:hypothetical protein
LRFAAAASDFRRARLIHHYGYRGQYPMMMKSNLTLAVCEQHARTLDEWRNSEDYKKMYDLSISDGRHTSDKTVKGLWRRAEAINFCNNEFWREVEDALRVSLPGPTYEKLFVHRQE